MNRHREWQIDLTERENELFEYLKSQTKVKMVDYAERQKRMDAALELTNSLLSREAIPEIRLKYFTDPRFNIGLKISRKQVFERNGTSGEDIFRHYHFLKFLFYFITGPDFPPATIEGFCRIYDECEPVTSGDLVEFQKYARAQTRAGRLEKSKSAEEFYKLSLEIGLQEYEARSIRDYVKRTK